MITTSETTISRLVFLDENNVCVRYYPEEVLYVRDFDCDDPSSVDPTYNYGDDFIKVSFFLDEESGQYYNSSSVNEDVYQILEYNGPSENIETGSTYIPDTNTFIPPPPVGVEGWIFDETLQEWHPDPTITYDLHGDGNIYRYDLENRHWIRVS